MRCPAPCTPAKGALLLVDCAQGVQAQTVANAYLAVEANLEIIPVLNKIDLPGARPDDVAEQLEHGLGIDPTELIRVSAKDRRGRRRDPRSYPRQDPAPGRRARTGTAARAGLRRDLRRLPRRHRLRACARRRVDARHEDQVPRDRRR